MTQSKLTGLQFSLVALIEYTTLCAILAALSGTIGVLAAVFLMAMALALGAGQGLLALALFMFASMAADGPASGETAYSPFTRQTLLIMVGGLVCLWYVARRRVFRAWGTGDRNANRDDPA